MYRVIVLAAVVLSAAVSTAPLHSQDLRTAASRIAARDSISDRVASQERELGRLRAMVLRQTAQIAEQAALIESGLPTTPQTSENGSLPVEVHGLVQAWFSDLGPSSSAFSMRRAEIAFGGSISPKVVWTIMVDPSKSLALRNTYSTVNGTPFITGSSVDQGSHILQDAFITVEYGDGMRLRFGQFHVPLSMEGLEGSGGLETIERALFASDHGRGGFYGDVRDVGISAFGSVGTGLEYTVGVFNGLGTGVGSAGGKGFAGRVVIRPPGELGLQLGGSSGYADNPRRERYGADVRLDRGPLVLKSEISAGRDGELHRFGYYGLAALRIQPQLQAVVRYDSWDPDTRAETGALDAAERNVTAGISYLVMGNTLKLQANYVRQWFAGGLAPSQNMLRINVQTSW